MILRSRYILATATLISLLVINACTDSTPTIEEPPDLFFSGTQPAFTGDEFNFIIEAEDPQGIDVELMIKDLPGWLTFLPTEATLSGTPSDNDEGLHIINVTADNGERARSRDLRIRVFKDQDEEKLQNGVENAIASFASGLRGYNSAGATACGRRRIRSGRLSRGSHRDGTSK